MKAANLNELRMRIADEVISVTSQMLEKFNTYQNSGWGSKCCSYRN